MSRRINRSDLGVTRRIGTRLRLGLFTGAAVMLRAATGASLAGNSHAMKLRAGLLIACTSLAMSIAGCLPVLAATRHVVLLFDERVELPGLSLLDAELVNTLRSNSTEQRRAAPPPITRTVILNENTCRVPSFAFCLSLMALPISGANGFG